MEQYARYRAPAESGQTLISPAWSELGSVVDANIKWRSRADISVTGQSLADFAAIARRELLERGDDYVATYCPAVASGQRADSDRPLILTGHQPEIVHPGVWLKNFVAASLAKLHGGTALNLVIDADACRSTAIRVPAGTVSDPRFASVEFDAPAAKVPWEERQIHDPRLWNTFAERVARETANLLPSRILDQWWPTAQAGATHTHRIGASLSQARHLTELQWNQRSLELPQSSLCQSESFRRFALHILTDLPRFLNSHNAALGDYRRRYRIRNHAHPVSNLAVRDSWLQTPFWIWSTEDPERRSLFARRDQADLILSDLASFERRLALGDGDWQAALRELAQLEASGIKLRSRALITTMFARLAVADLFIHGIGGAKYDEVTDDICQRFFGTAPPMYATVSGTLRLPIAHPPASNADVRRFRQELRELDYHPERFAASHPSIAADTHFQELHDQKRRWIATAKSPQSASERHAVITSVNHRLQPFIAPHRSQLERQLAEVSAQSRANRILDSREYAFCLFPPDHLKQFLLDFAPRVL